MALSRNTKIGIFITFITVVVSTTFYFYQLFFASNFLVGEEKSRFLYIPEGGNWESVKDSLETNKLVHDFLPFAFVSKMLGYQKIVKPGAYEISPNEANFSVIRRLKAGRQTPIKLTFNSFRTKRQLAEKLDQKLGFSAQDILSILNDPAKTATFGLDTFNIISVFVPNTYEVYWTIKPEALMEKMKSAYEKLWNEDRLAKAKALNLSPAQVMTVASITQSETNKVDEMPRVAGVYLNRLAQNMPLQADPTVVFAVGDFEIKRVLSGHKETDSPYNTYKYGGLPPGPIAIAIRPAIDAVLNYEKHDYLFFCAREDFSGYHNFTNDFNEHLRNARIYQAALNKAGIH
ncbi:MAG TPA: endolytic transglycosylase MltG [Catalimonadaceae bacterium]|nr:endolytic transglycosylase MltG [Catalimonadaceae bacterium]HPI12772.1 endolytic transglycosylase MltG [Catalimonadaceae bacterium]